MPDDLPNLEILVDNENKIAEALRQLAGTRVLVGIPSAGETGVSGSGGGSETRKPPTIGNAALGYIHEHGSPINNIPPRPWLVPGVTKSKDQWSNYLIQAGKLAFEGNTSGLDKALHAAGITAVSAVKAGVLAGIPPPLKPATIRARRRRSKGSSYRRQAVSAQDVTPLVDTAQMLNSVGYVIRKGKR